ncbi:hypothetical protein B566_EDAN015148 [Ephemera danica]|nr:hypothetical protein B566_EDAN015148 [Ephemera danica]
MGKSATLKKTKKENKVHKFLSKYYDARNPESFSGARRLIEKGRDTGISRNTIVDWLRSQETYTRHKPVIRKFKRRFYYASRDKELWQCDLCDLRSLNRENNGYNYLLTCIDIFSKFASVRPLKDKKPASVVKALRDIFKTTKPEKINTDKGSEFTTKTVQNFLHENDVKFYTTQDPTVKAAVVERFNRSLKERMWRYFTYKQTHKYIDRLNDFVSSFNNAYHKSIRMKPVQVKESNLYEVWTNLYGDKKLVDRKKPLHSTSVESGHYEIVKPLNAITEDSNAIEFVIPGHTGEYLDLSHTELHAKLQIVKTGNAALAAADSVAPINYILQTMFSSVEVYLNNKLITPVNNTAAYRAYIEMMLNYSTDVKQNQMSAKLVEMDTHNAFDTCTDANFGYKTRRAYFAESKVVDAVGYMHSDLFNQDRFLLSGVDVRLKFIRGRDTFCLMSDTLASGKLKIHDMTLHVRRAEINPSIALAHAEALKLTPAKYPINRVDVKVLTIPSGVQSKSLDNVYTGQLPIRVTLAFVENKAYNGNYKKNPFFFKHFGLTSLSLIKNGKQIPTRPLECDFDGGHYINAYQTLLSGSGINFTNTEMSISRDQYSKGYTLFIFDLSPDLSASCHSHWQLKEVGSLGLELRFAAALTDTVNCIVYAEFENLIEITKDREVTVDYAC